MTAAIGQKFLGAPSARSATGGAAARNGSSADGKSAFDDLVHAGARRGDKTARRSDDTRSPSDAAGSRHRHAEAETPTAATAGDPEVAGAGTTGKAEKWIHHRHKGIEDGSTDDKTRDEDQPEQGSTADAPPLRDRLPLLVTLNELGHRRDAATAAAPDRMPEGTDPARSGKVGADGEPAAQATAAAATVTATAEQPFKVVAAMALTPREPGRPAERGETAVGSAATPSAPRNARDGQTATSPAAATAVSGDDGAPATDDNGIASTNVERRPSHGNDASHEPDSLPRGGPERQASGSVTVTGDRSFPAPAAHLLNPTTAGVIEALAAAGSRAAAHPVSQHLQAPTVAHPAQVLRIELHPAELGTVVASLRLSGTQLSVELKPETAEAYRRLSNDGDAIAKSLKKLGLDVDTVTVLQPSIATPPTTRTDAGNQASFAPGRDASQSQSGTSGGGGDSFGGQQPGRNRSHDGQAQERTAPAHRQRAGGDLFI